MRFAIFIVLLFLIPINSPAQNLEPSVFIDKDAPSWVALMHQSDRNVNEIKAAYTDYYKKHPFEKNTYTQHYKRWMQWVRPYVQSDGKIYIPTFQEQRDLEQNIIKSRSEAINRGGNWTFNGPKSTYHTDGSTKVTWQTNIYSLDVSKSNPNIVYAGGETGGVWKSTDKGISWTLTTKNVVCGAFGAVKIDPTNPNNVYATTGGKLIKTTDGGNSWATVYSESNFWADCIAISESNPNIVLVAGELGFYRSTDGNTFTKQSSNKSWTVHQKVGDGSTFYMVEQNGTTSNFRKSTDFGASWTIYNSGWFAPASGESVEGVMLSVCPSNANKIYAYLCGSGGTLNGYIGVFKSIDGGVNWTNTNPSNSIGGTYVIPTHTNLMANNGSTGFNQGFYDMAIITNPTNENELIAGGTSWFKSTDGGATWNSLGGYVGTLGWSHPDIQALAANGTDLYIASDGGLNYSNDFGGSIEARMDGISGSDMWGFDSGWNTDILVGGRYHNGNMTYHESFNSGDYYRMGGAEAATGYVNPGPGNKVYHSDIGGHKIIEGFGNGATGFSVGAWPNESYAYYANSEMAFHPNYYNTVFIGKDNSIWKSTDGGTSFSILYTFTGNSGNVVMDIEIARSNPNVMYCSQWDGTDDSIWKTTDGGTTWNKITALPLPNNNDRVKMAVSSTDANVLWVAVTYGSNGKKVYKTTNGGTSWTNLTTSQLDGFQVTNIMAQYGTNDGVYIGTSGGVFYRNNTHGTWQTFSSGLPLSFETNRIKPFYKNNKVRIGAWGNGVWESDLFEVSTPQAMPTVSNKNVGCVRDTLFFDDYSVLNHSGASWNWTFPGATYVSATNIRNPKVVYGNPGSYSVTLNITDASGQNSSKTVNNMVTVGNLCTPDTIPGKALSLTTSSQYGVVNDYNLDNVTELTVTAWVKPNGIQPDYSSIFMNNGSAAGFNFKNGNNSLAYHWPGGQWWWNSNLIVTADQWNFVAIVVKPTGVFLVCNEDTARHNISLTPVDITSFHIGNYQGWGDRTMKGLVDEVAIYNKALTLDEIRMIRHQTKVPATDPSLISYYQFNTTDNPEYDKVGTKHISLVGGAGRITSTAPVGAGSTRKINVTNGGMKDFGGTDVKMYFKSSGTYPNGDIYVTKINQKPDVLPYSTNTPNCYWAINNYGSNKTFTVLDSIIFGNSGNILPGYTPNSYELFKRPTYAEGASWGTLQDAGDYVNPTSPGKVTFSTNNNITSFSQMALMRNNNPLAVKFINFFGELKNNQVYLLWNTENEVRTKKYIIERSLDGEQFSEIGTVNSLSFSINHYNFIDKSPFVGNNYYRICELDENGLKSNTNIIVINNSAPNKIEVYPNILNRNEQINIIVPNNEPFTIKVFDAKAVQVYYQEFTGQQNLPINLSSGIYFYIIESKSNMLNGKLVIR